MGTSIPPWLEQLRRSEIVERVRHDPRSTHGTSLGVGRPTAMQAIGWGQATFDEPWGDLSPEDRVLLYAYFNQPGHLEELTEAFRQLFATTPSDARFQPIVVDLGCGPITGGLALAGVLGPEVGFDYIGMDQSHAMRRFGEQLAVAAERFSEMPPIVRHWVPDLSSLSWTCPPGWRPVIVVVSYLLASPTLEPPALVAEIGGLLAKLGRGSVTVLYTNSPKSYPNRSFPEFRSALRNAGFGMHADDTGRIEVDRWEGPRERHLRYALFHRPKQQTLKLQED